MGWSLKESEKQKVGNITWLEWVKNLEAEGNDVTGMLDEEPDLFPHLHAYWNAFHILSSSRNSGMSVGAIPLPAYESYFRIFGVDSLEERLEYIKYIGVLDSKFIEWQGEKSEKEQKKQKSKQKGYATTKR